MNKLAEWTNTWFIRPSTCERPSARVESIWVFLALVSIMGPKMPSANLRFVHAYFTYLLLECDPRVLISSANTSETQTDTDFSDLKRIYEQLLDFTRPNVAAPKWNLLMTYIRLSPQVLSYTVTDKLSDQLARLTMALALVGKPVLPDKLLFVKSCLGLFQRSLDYKVTASFETEFYASTPMFYASWLYDAIDQAFKIGTMSTEGILNTISYMAWFANLVRASRILKAANDQRPETFGIIDSVLKEQINDLNDVLDSAPLRLESFPSNTHLLDVFGIRPKKKIE